MPFFQQLQDLSKLLPGAQHLPPWSHQIPTNDKEQLFNKCLVHRTQLFELSAVHTSLDFSGKFTLHDWLATSYSHNTTFHQQTWLLSSPDNVFYQIQTSEVTQKMCECNVFHCTRGCGTERSPQGQYCLMRRGANAAALMSGLSQPLIVWQMTR